MTVNDDPHAPQTSKLPPTFRELGVAAEICDALAESGITRTFAIQELTLPLALAGRDIIGQARTGMGKTLGFGVPILDRVFDDADVPELNGIPHALIVAPTRELAVQVGEDLKAAATRLPVTVFTVYGGRPYEEQIKALKAGVDVVVGTPGRLLDLHEQGYLNLSEVASLVLDEADEMLDLGFLPDIEKLMEILADTPHQTMLFSATMPGDIVGLARRFMHHAVNIRAESDAPITQATTRKVTFQAHKMDKEAVITQVLQARGRGRTIIFARTKRSAAQLADDLGQAGFLVGAVHGDLGQAAREKSLNAFRRGEVDMLVATDVAARGIDVDDVTHVINYQVPDDPQTFVHRIGRTGRAGRTGTAVTLVGYDELAKWQVINDELSLGQPEPPQWFSTSPELHEALDIPKDARPTVGPPRRVIGVRPRSERREGKFGRGAGRGSRSRSRSRRHLR